eukprot:GGOE01013679.1.p1 GENE.GGOE01013679.1~~GGOE01013679.1.p1  ORF type:complete len:165 (-),score=43.55 GGOE01013679.1:152-622(-)
MSDDVLVAQAREIFNFFEKNGMMHLNHLATAVRAMNLNPSEKQLAEWRDELDTSHTGLLSFENFKVFVLEQLKLSPDTKEMLMNAFKVLDKAGCGFVETKELKALMTSMGEKYTDEEFEELVRFSNRNGFIKYSEFVDRLLLSYQQLGDELGPIPH